MEGDILEIYLDNAATSHPKPEGVARAAQEALTRLNANPGRSSHRRALAAMRAISDCREAVARALGAEADDIAFTLNATDALNLAIKGALRPGDHVVTTCLEHNSVLRPLAGLLEREAISLSVVPPRPDGVVDPADILSALRPNTRLVACTHASNVTGAVQPVEVLGGLLREKGVLFLVDGSQALGSLPVDVRRIGCQLYAFPGHKGLLGPQGTGGLYIAPDTELKPLREGGTGTSSDRLLQPEERPERYESGTLNLPGLCGLREGVRFAMEHLQETQRAEAALTGMLTEGLREIGAEVYCPDAPRTGAVSFNLPGLSSAAVTDQLDRAGICVRGGLHCAPLTHRHLGTLRRGAVRASVGPANTQEDIEALLAVLRAIQKA